MWHKMPPLEFQINGGFTVRGMVDLSHPMNEADVDAFVDFMEDCGTTRALPTIVTTDWNTYETNLPLLAKAIRGRHKNRLLGFHLEGPFLSPDGCAIGAHPKHCVRLPSVDDFRQLDEWADGTILMITLAPELAGAEELIRYCSDHNVLVSLGHHNAKFPDLERARAAGAKLTTHVGNACARTFDRYDPALWAQLVMQGMYAMLIPDGQHLTPDFLRAAIREARTPEFTIAVSDASPAAKAPAGRHSVFGNLEIDVLSDGTIVRTDNQHPAGSGSMLIDCMNHLFGLGYTHDEIELMTVKNPWSLIQAGIKLRLGRTLQDYEWEAGERGIRRAEVGYVMSS